MQQGRWRRHYFQSNGLLYYLILLNCRIFDREEAFTHAEASLAADVVSQGRGLIIALNKMDLVQKKYHAKIEYLVAKKVRKITPEVGSPIQVPISALKSEGTENIFPAASNLYSMWNRRIPTGKLNKWLQTLISEKPVGGGKEIKRIKYISQVKSRPPTFVAFLSSKAPLSHAAQRFIANQIRQEFGLDGIPARVIVRRGD